MVLPFLAIGLAITRRGALSRSTENALVKPKTQVRGVYNYLAPLLHDFRSKATR